MNKNALKSKTFWFGIITAVAPLIPAVGVWISENVATFGMIWGSLTVLLRWVTKDKIILIE